MIAESEITRIVQQIAERFAPERVILFGSYGYGTPTEDSDVDVLVILPFEGKGFWKSLEIANYLKPRFSLDLIAKTPEDIRRRYEQGDPLVREALDKGRVLYE